MTKIQRLNTAKSYFTIIDDEIDDRAKGVYCITEKWNEKQGKYFTEYLHICTVAYIQFKIKVNDKNYYKVVYYDRDIEKEIYIDAKDLLINGSKNSYDIDKMISNGFIITEKCRSFVLEYFKTQAPLVNEVAGTDKTGWHGEHYISNGFNTSSTIYAGRSNVAFIKAGSESEQVDFFKAIFKENPLIFFIVSYCYAGIISKWILEGEANPLLAVTGLSSKGKTTAEMLAISGFSHPSKYSSFNSTAGALENLVQQHEDLFICLDESGESKIKADDKISFVYSLANGRTKNRLKRVGEEYDTSDINPKKYSLLICGEESLLNGLRQTDGIKVRLNELTLSKDLNLWDSIRNNNDAEQINLFMHQNYGHIVPLFINEVRKELPLLSVKFKEQLESIRYTLGSTNDIVNRKAKVLAYSYTSAYYLARVVFKDEPEVIDDYLYEMYLSAEKGLFSDIADFEESRDRYKDILAHLEDTHQQYFSTLNDELNKKEWIGEIKQENGKKTINVVNNQWNRFCELIEVPESVFMQYLKDNNLLHRDKSGKSTISRKGKRYYSIVVPDKYFEDEQVIIKKEIQEEIDDEVPIFDADLK